MQRHVVIVVEPNQKLEIQFTVSVESAVDKNRFESVDDWFVIIPQIIISNRIDLFICINAETANVV